MCYSYLFWNRIKLSRIHRRRLSSLQISISSSTDDEGGGGVRGEGFLQLEMESEFEVGFHGFHHGELAALLR